MFYDWINNFQNEIDERSGTHFAKCYELPVCQMIIAKMTCPACPWMCPQPLDVTPLMHVKHCSPSTLHSLFFLYSEMKKTLFCLC